jgi:putative FmdB family regulatory protein
MPTYEYKCDKCGHQFEIMQKMSDEPVKNCPECSGKVRRIFSTGGIILKGSGFYHTEYGKGKDNLKKEKNESSCSSGSCCPTCTTCS